MAIEFMDNFSIYGTDETLMTDGIYAQTGGVTLMDNPDGVTPGKVVFQSGGNGNNRLRKVSPLSTATKGCGFRLWFDSLPSSSGDAPSIIQFCDMNNSPQITVRAETTGALSVYRGNGSDLLATTAGPVITAGAWHHIETKVVIDDSAGSVEVRVNGIAVISLTNEDTKASSLTEVSQIQFRPGYSGLSRHDYYLNDLIIWNGEGSENNDFLGDIQVVTLLPTADDTFPWTPSTGTTGWDLLAKTGPNEATIDATYISADDAPPAACVFDLSDLDPDIVTVKGLMTVVRQFKNDGGTANTQVSLVSGSDEDNGADRPITTAATYWMDVSELDPATGAAWTPTAVDAAQLKIDRTV